MTTADLLASPDVRSLIVRISVPKYHTMLAAGVVPQRSELIQGVVFEKMTKSPRHTLIVNRLFRYFNQQVGEDYLVRKEDPLTLASSEPEPDISIVKASLDDFAVAHPTSAELVIEVAVTSAEMDRAKANIYATAEVEEYWIILVSEQAIERYCQPQDGEYRERSTFGADDTMVTNYGSLSLAELFS